MKEDSPQPDVKAVYEIEGDRVMPSWYAQGPWNPQHQHGGAACALLARTLEQVPCADETMRFKRIHFDLMRGVPIAPLRTTTRIVRDGRRIQLVDVSLFDGDTEVARASGLRMRIEPVNPEANLTTDEPLPFTPGEGASPTIRVAELPGFLHALNFVRADGEPDGKSSRTVWIRLHLPIVAGEETTPLVRLAATSDYTSGIASALDFQRFQSINPDVTLQIHRYPESDWIALRGRSEMQTDGTGQSESELYDERGRIGRGLTSQLVFRVSPASPSG